MQRKIACDHPALAEMNWQHHEISWVFPGSGDATAGPDGNFLEFSCRTAQIPCTSLFEMSVTVPS
jgi:hypothetical protein